MSKVELVAVKPFSYMTRRLKAGDSFEARASEAKILVKLGKAETQRIPGDIAPPPASVAAKIEAAATPEPAGDVLKVAGQPIAAISAKETVVTSGPRKGRRTRKAPARK